MIDRKKCVRCCKEVVLFEYEEAEDWEENLLEEGISIDPGDAICDECAQDILASLPQ